MEYEVIAALGSLCDIDDLETIAEASQWVNRYVMDGISTGACIAFAMECYEHGILTSEDCDGLELTWGNTEVLIPLIHRIARREGIGDLLANGVKRAAEKIGKDSQRFALHVKGQELPMHEPRGKKGVGLGYAISPTGADHLEAEHDPVFESFGREGSRLSEIGLYEPIDRFDLGPRKVRAFFYCQMVWSLYNSLGMCDFVGIPLGRLKLSAIRDYVSAATGWDMSLFELLKVGERANTLARIFNTREGFSAKDDLLPQRMFEPLQNGHLKGKSMDPEELHNALQIYYQMAGWDQQGVPTSAKLSELDIEFVDFSKPNS
jgi:aldehyde:ferredoxin oxidoreductase